MARWFLYLAPGYHDEAELLEDGPQRARLLDRGASVTFLEEAEPGDVQALWKRDRWLLRVGRVFNDDDGNEGGWT